MRRASGKVIQEKANVLWNVVNTIFTFEKLVADLEQYKKSLIFECVTGKREVA